ncbi:Cysteine-rich RLK (RECEPTOR-like protein kinase) 8 [Gossypium australe]|uniref:Cysteine-rich RLK (RECEPTOR-like protein kinase) 8 n=1 Tax=Gossypium australe TaxID=47621 RepID=A0A5B6VC41_9ROSI|nr:Cysteine-rich RLK (RECEPTOR-like protein kinase) 8 [Gossypium australe]
MSETYSSTSPSPTPEITSNLEIFSGSDAQSDSSGLNITCHRVNGNNFLEWSQSVKIFLLGRDRLGYVTGEIKQPAVPDIGFARWMRDNGQVMTWLLNSMTPSISRNFLLYNTAAEIWSAVRETYSINDNIAELYHVENQAATLKQGTMLVTLYYNTLTALWQQLDLYAQHDWAVPRDAALYQQIVTQRRLFQFLHGLNKELDEVRGRVLAISPLPSLREAFSMDWKSKNSRDNKSSLAAATSVTRFSKEQIAELQKLLGKFQGSSAADGSLCKIEGHGTVVLIDQIALHNVLFVPNLACNLISVSKISSDLNCFATFNGLNCTLQALNSKKMIGKASLQNGLYILPSSPKPWVFKSFTALNTVDNVMLWHFRLGHPSFQYLAKLFPDLFINKRPNSFSCKVCSLAKHTKSSYFPSPYKPSHPFALIHSDIWGPSRVKNADHSKWFITFIDDHNLSPVTTPINSTVIPINTSSTPTLNTPPENTRTPIENLQQTSPPKQLRVYTRKKKNIPETVLQSDSCRELDLGPATEMEEEICKSSTLDDFPIAIRKGVRQCTKHPIEKFAGYNALMPSFQAFTATLDKEQIPTSIAEALKDPKWRRAVEEEIGALEKNATWTVTTLP